jgi:hypothetical protein
LRLATAPEQRDQPSFYLDLATVDADDAEAEASVAMRRLSRPTSLLVLDNVHHRPELARQLWDHWRERPCGSSLLLVATRMQRTVTTAPAQDLGFFEHHPTNPAVQLRPSVSDLGAIVKYLYDRVGGTKATPLPMLPRNALEAWHRNYGSALGAFCLAVLGHLAEFQRGHWELPLESAAHWVREKWLQPLDVENRDNVLCLAVFGSQELELPVLNDALLYPGKTNQLLQLGLVEKTHLGQFGQYERLTLREPGWGRLILAAQLPPADEQKIMFEMAARNPTTTIALSARLRRGRLFGHLERLWGYLATTPHNLISKVIDGRSLSTIVNWIEAANGARQSELANRIWEHFEREPDELAALAYEAPLHDVARFLELAKRYRRNTARLWTELESQPDKLAERAWETPLPFLASFLETAKRHGRDTAPLWTALESDPDKLAALALDAPLDQVGLFLDTAKRNGRDTKGLVEALERWPTQLSAKAKEAEVWQLANFCRHAPDPLVKIALSEFQTTHWDGIPLSKPLVGATRIANRCATVGREDLESALLMTLLRRANPLDFPSQGGSLAGLVWLLRHVPTEGVGLVSGFLGALCTGRWLRRLYTNAAAGPLANGLRMLALHQPTQHLRRFNHPSLGIRLRDELLRFAQADKQEQIEIIELLGCASLFGFSAKREWFDDVPISAIGTLPADVLPHPSNANKVDHWQFQLWLGLRAVTEVTGKPLAVPSAVIVRTLDLWRSNLAETSINAGSTEHCVNESMVTWLESCSRGNEGLVPPPA